MEDLRSDFHKFLDVIKHTLTQDEYISLVKSNNKSSKDILIELLRKSTEVGK